MKGCLGDLHLNYGIIYINDIIIYSEIPADHVFQLWKGFEKLAYAGLKLKSTKCDFHTRMA